MPAPLDPDKRAAIAQAIRDGGTAHGIARQHGVAQSTVSKIAKDDGLEDAFDRTRTKDATEARTADLAKWRLDFAERLARRAEWIDQRIDEQQTVVVGSMEGPVKVRVPASSRDVRDYLVAAGIAVDKIGVLTRDDSQGLGAVDAWLRSLGVGATQG